MRERGDLRQALCGSGYIHSRCIDPATLEVKASHKTEGGVARRLLRDVRIAQYFEAHLKIKGVETLGRLVAFAPGGGAGQATPAPLGDAVVDRLFEAFHLTLPCRPGCTWC